jgi:hypothetical protein
MRQCQAKSRRPKPMNTVESTAINWDAVMTRTATRGQDGKLASVLTGNETDEELRVLTLRFTQHYQFDQGPNFNPFRVLGGLPRETLHKMITEMDREAMLFLFESECEYRNRKPTGVEAAKP